jgi:choline dehydrogenase-like flavoprotein
MGVLPLEFKKGESRESLGLDGTEIFEIDLPSDIAAMRAAALTELAGRTFDVLVIGGGITGAGIARDAALRGLKVALVEKTDFAAGTSSKSSKLVHGGIRYLQQREVGLVYEALAERQVLRKTAPHLVRVLPFLLPVFTRDGLLPRRIARLLGATMWMYDLTGGLRIGKALPERRPNEPVDQRQRAIRSSPSMNSRSNRKRTSEPPRRMSLAFWIKLKAVRPSGSTPQSSPSR